MQIVQWQYHDIAVKACKCTTKEFWHEDQDLLTIMYNRIKTRQTSSKKQLSQTVAAFMTEKQFETFIVAGLKDIDR